MTRQFKAKGRAIAEENIGKEPLLAGYLIAALDEVDRLELKLEREWGTGYDEGYNAGVDAAKPWSKAK